MPQGGAGRRGGVKTRHSLYERKANGALGASGRVAGGVGKRVAGGAAGVGKRRKTRSGASRTPVPRKKILAEVVGKPRVPNIPKNFSIFLLAYVFE